MWRKIAMTNNWGALEYSLDEKQIDATLMVSADVLWPDGTISRNMPIKCVPVYDRICDMGHYYDVHTNRLVIADTHHGAPIEIDLTEVEIEDGSIAMRESPKLEGCVRRCKVKRG